VQVNDMLDALAAGPNREAKVKALMPVLVKMNIEQIHWLCCIILKGVACCAAPPAFRSCMTVRPPARPQK
jgi:hypothetical protein